jgi:hypothetical protein
LQSPHSGWGGWICILHIWRGRRIQTHDIYL